ncbi:hypothetical protein GA0115236_10857 [Streptomyces sp. IgraMP-1]|nr:hypothetical protein GA0115236_10857 [Streptomyces sp. IgraMP-1]
MRQAAYEQIVSHLDLVAVPPRLELVVRSWVSLAESTALLWLDGRRTERAALELQLVHDFGALVAVAGAYDEEIAGVVRRILAPGTPGRPVHRPRGTPPHPPPGRGRDRGADAGGPGGVRGHLARAVPLLGDDVRALHVAHPLGTARSARAESRGRSLAGGAQPARKTATVRAGTVKVPVRRS